MKLEWLNRKLLDEYLDERAKKWGAKINTERSVKMIETKLEGFHNRGYDVDTIISHGIETGWRSLFVPVGMEPRQKHLKASGPLFNQARAIVEKKKMPEHKATNYGRKASDALKAILDENS